MMSAAEPWIGALIAWRSTKARSEGFFEAPADKAEAAMVLIRSVMEKAAGPAVALTVPLVVDARAAGNWDEAH